MRNFFNLYIANKFEEVVESNTQQPLPISNTSTDTSSNTNNLVTSSNSSNSASSNNSSNFTQPTFNESPIKIVNKLPILDFKLPKDLKGDLVIANTNQTKYSSNNKKSSAL
jgi:hypothetical protein